MEQGCSVPGQSVSMERKSTDSYTAVVPDGLRTTVELGQNSTQRVENRALYPTYASPRNQADSFEVPSHTVSQGGSSEKFSSPSPSGQRSGLEAGSRQESKSKSNEKDASGTPEFEPYLKCKWLPSRRARANTLQKMEIQKLQHEFEEKDFAEMEREEFNEQAKKSETQKKPDEQKESEVKTTTLESEEQKKGGGTEEKKKKSQKKKKPKTGKEDGVPKKRAPMDIAKLEERLAQQADKPRQTVTVDPVTGEKRRLLKCTLCMAYNSLKVCAKGMCSRCCPVGGNPCEAHSQRQKKIDAMKEAGMVTPSPGGGNPTPSTTTAASPLGAISGVASTSSSPSPSSSTPTQVNRKYKKRKSTDAETMRKLLPSSSSPFDEADRSKKRRTESPSTPTFTLSEADRLELLNREPSMPPPQSLAALLQIEESAVPHNTFTATSSNNNNNSNSICTTATTMTPIDVDLLDESGKGGSQQKCSLCHSNNYLKQCLKGMCCLCCFKDGVPCQSHILQETLKKNAESAQNKREQERRPVKLDKNGRRIPLKCAKCTAYNAMKDCTRDLCSVCCKKDTRGPCQAHALVINKPPKIKPTTPTSTPTTTTTVSSSVQGSTPPRSIVEQGRLKKEEGGYEQNAVTRAGAEGMVGEDFGETSNYLYQDGADDASSRHPAKRRWTEMAKAETTTTTKREGDENMVTAEGGMWYIGENGKDEGKREGQKDGVMVADGSMVPTGVVKRKIPAKCKDCNSNNALRSCSKGMCSLCCSKDGNACTAHLLRTGDLVENLSELGGNMADGAGWEDTDRMRPLKKRYLEDPKAILTTEAPNANSSTKTEEKRGNSHTDEHKPTRHLQKCMNCNAYNMLKTCTNSMCSVCCMQANRKPCIAHMKRTDGGVDAKVSPRGRGRKPKSMQQVNVFATSDVQSSRRAKQNTIAKMRLQQLQDEFDSFDDDEEGEDGGGDKDSSESSSDGENEKTLPTPKPAMAPPAAPPSREKASSSTTPRGKRPKAVAATSRKGKEKVKDEKVGDDEWLLDNNRPPFSSSASSEWDPEDEATEMMEFDLGSDYEQDFVDDLQFIACEKRVAGNSPNKKQKMSNYDEKGNFNSNHNNNSTTMIRVIKNPPFVSTHNPPYKRKSVDTRCANCKTTRAHMWRDGWIPEGEVTPVTLCSSCGSRYNKDMFCSYCNYIYMADEDWETTKWIGCDMCNKWIHRKCEEKRLGFSIDQSDLYLCPSCRIKHSRSSSEEVLSEKMKRDELRRRKRKLRKKQLKEQKEQHKDNKNAT